MRQLTEPTVGLLLRAILACPPADRPDAVRMALQELLAVFCELFDLLLEQQARKLAPSNRVN